MAKQIKSPPRESLTAWLAKQIAAKALGVALGLPLVTGTVMAVLAWLQGLPLATGLLFVVLAAAGASTILNQARTFSLAYSLAEKFEPVGFLVEAAKSRQLEHEGYGVAVTFQSSADVAIQYIVDKCRASLDGRVIPIEEGISTVYDVEAYGARQWAFGIAPTGLKPSATILGDIEVTYRYGRPGKLNISRTAEHRIWVVTDAMGMVTESRIFSKD